jgi:cell division protein FtsB
MSRDIDGIKMDDIFKKNNGLGARSAGQSPKIVDEAVAAEEKSPEADQPSKGSDKRVKKNNPKGTAHVVLIVIAVLAILGLGAWGIYSYTELQKLRDPELVQQQTEEQVKADTQALVEKVGKLIKLPEGEPVVATVTDKEKLTDQPFFASSENGDKVLIYSESSMAYIYRESENKIINSGPIAIVSDDASATPTE